MTRLQVRPIKDYCLGIFDGPHATPKESDEGLVFLGIKNLTNDGRLDLTEIRHVSEQEFPRWTRRVTPQEGDVVFTYEATLHRYAVIPEGFRGCLGRRVALVRPDPDHVDSRYLLYYFLSHRWRRVVEGSIISGATVDRVPLEKFPSFPAALPSLPVQREVASILSAYDDLIENNRRRMVLLEEAARQLYREWFVRLRFPGHEHTRIIDGVPERWEQHPISELVVGVFDGPHATPPSADDGPVFLGIKNITESGRLDLTDVRHIAENDFPRWTKRVQPSSGDVVFSYEATLHRYALIPPGFRGCLGRRLALIRPDPSRRNGIFLFQSLLGERWRGTVEENIISGATVDRIPIGKLPDFPLLMPPDHLVHGFDDVASDLYRQIQTLTMQNERVESGPRSPASPGDEWRDRRMTHLFFTLDSHRIVDLIRSAERFVCYAGPGVQMAPAQVMAEVARRLGVEMVTVALDFAERVMRMGFGDMNAVKILRQAGIVVRDAPGLRAALVLVDDQGYLFTPTALYLEADPQSEQAANAKRLSTEQLREALARLSPVAKAIAVAQASDEQEREHIASLPVEVGTEPVTGEHLARVDQSLKEAPPVQFDLVRQVRVFNAYLQYVELHLTGAAIQRHRLTIPPNILKLGGSKDLEGRLRTTFDLIEKGGKLSSKKLEDELNEIRKNFTPSIGKDHGRVVLKSAKPHLEERLRACKANLEAHQKNVAAELQGQLDESRKQMIDYYLPRVVESPPDAMLGQMLHPKPTEEDARLWLDAELTHVFPDAEVLIQKMQLDVRYKDVTFETLSRPDFLQSVKDAFPRVDRDKPYREFLAAGETEPKE